jgi:general secretion pathway protein A
MAEAVAPVAQSAPAIVAGPELDALTARITILEQRVIEQEAALRRVLSMMIDWMDKESRLDARFMQNNRAA